MDGQGQNRDDDGMLALGDGQSGDTGARGRQTPLVQRVYQLLLAQISAGDYQPDERLPGENDLATRFAVSRPIVREALRRLRAEGLIYSRQGAGSFVRAAVEDSRPLLGYAPVETIADIQRCYEFRLTIEPDHAFHAARRWNDAALANIAAALDLMGDATRAQRHRDDADFAFHVAIAEATNNHYYASSMQALKDHIAVGMKFHGVSLMGPSPGLDGVFDEHRGIFEAIRARDGDTARARMRRHLEGSRDRVFEGRTLDLSL
ncbi:FadR/GntR family transcriptional regulator [Azospirillum griseum]|uniref:FadR family transcriptional regulator n=1 Tax=Azospirillum griseum TaxID=2496639 RepID=A0A3S0JJ50_9PROT|nr:FadR/GntR family transcriptional regulator [Azospirillum griseum]RTR21077.1 FadR family transcriptional regulator [Azospirillum griseum]